MAPRPCLEPNCSGLALKGPRCTHHEREHQRRRRANGPHRGEWQRLAKKTVEAHIAEIGYWCPGWGTPPHPSQDLCADHVVARDPSRLQVLCRACNGRKSVNERR